MTNNLAITKKLKTEFIAKINEDWHAKWSQNHGNTFEFNDLKSQNAFLDDLLDDIEKTIKPKIGLDETSKILISKDNLRRIFKQDKISSWQDKTRNTLAYYVGYDGGWQEFAEKHIDENLQIDSISNFRGLLANINKSIWILAFIFSLLIIYLCIHLAFQAKPKVRFDLSSHSFMTFPASVRIDYNLMEDSHTTAMIGIENEQFQDINQPTMINLDSQKGQEIIHFFTPGLKKITLLIDNKLVEERYCLVGTGKEWYASLRTKKVDIPEPYEDNQKKSWFGLRNNQSNTNYESKNILSNPNLWREYIHPTSNTTKYPDGHLHFPEDSTKKTEKSFSRVAFFKADNYDIDIDSAALSFDAKKSNTNAEDCLSFMTQMFDENLNCFELYSSSGCEILSNIFLYEYKWLPKSNVLQKEEFVKNNKLNLILEDNEWHHFDIIFNKKKVTIIIDKTQSYNLKYTFNYKKLREIWFVFEGNGYIDNVKLSNSTTTELVFCDDFSRQKKHN